MCGIAGFVIAPGDFGRVDTESMTRILGYEMKSRGRDATGIYTADPKGRWKVRKSPNPADVFLAYRYGIGTNAKSLLLHARAATQGKPHIPGNNHPIKHGKIVGIHNGVVWNDDKLFDHFKWERDAQVDSEAIFAALNYLPQREALENIQGSWAIAWVDTEDDPNKLWLCRGSSSPLHYAATVNGSIVFASTPAAVKEAFGGITGKVEPTAAPEGFLAYIDPEGGLNIQDSPDTSGKNAIGKREAITYGGRNSHYSNGTWQDDWRPYGTGSSASIPTGASTGKPLSYVRVNLTGVKAKPVIGDLRKYLTNADTTVYEVCTSAGNLISWKPVESPAILERCKRLDPACKAVVIPFDQGEELGSVVGTSSPEILPEGPGLDNEIRYGYAEPGDMIVMSKNLLGPGAGHGHLAAEVLRVNEEDRTITVAFREARISKYSTFEIVSRKGVNAYV